MSTRTEPYHITKALADRYEPIGRAIIGQMLTAATDEALDRAGIDLETKSGRCGMRVRQDTSSRWMLGRNDFGPRLTREGRPCNEMAKTKNNGQRYYLYAWAEPGTTGLRSFVVLDSQVVRKWMQMSQYVDSLSPIVQLNEDGTVSHSWLAIDMRYMPSDSIVAANVLAFDSDSHYSHPDYGWAHSFEYVPINFETDYEAINPLSHRPTLEQMREASAA